MKRRFLLQTLAVAPAAPVALQAQATAPSSVDTKLVLNMPSAVGEQRPTFFTPDELTTLRALCSALVPAALGRPGAVDCGAVEFLDFLAAESPASEQELWRSGLQRLHKAGFATLTPPQTAAILEPLKAKWSFYGPSEPFAKFLWTARDEILRATVNSREYAQANAGRRSSGGLNYYWRSLD